jgi:hypothetical protein
MTLDYDYARKGRFWTAVVYDCDTQQTVQTFGPLSSKIVVVQDAINYIEAYERGGEKGHA